MARGEGANLVVALNGDFAFLGTIVATTTINNHDTATPFNNTGSALKGMTLLVQASAACHIYPGPLNTSTATTTNGLKLATDEKYILTMSQNNGWLAVVGAASLKVWQLT